MSAKSIGENRPKFNPQKLIQSHPISECLLLSVFGRDYHGIFDLHTGKQLKPTTCKWLHLCLACDSATSEVENEFNQFYKMQLTVNLTKFF